MNAVEFINSLSEIDTRIDKLSGADEKLAALQQWLIDIHSLSTIVLLDFDSGEAHVTGNVQAEHLDQKGLCAFGRTLPDTPGVVSPARADAELLKPALKGARLFVHVPLTGEGDRPFGALFLTAKKPAAYFKAHKNEIGLVAVKMRDLVLIKRLRSASGKTHDGGAHGGNPDGFERTGYFINAMNHPMFVMRPNGELVTVNTSLLAKFRAASLREFTRCCDIFHDLAEQGEILKTIDQEGGIRSRRLTLHDSRGEQITVTISAVVMGGMIVGSLFDVSQYVKVADDLRESLKMQEFLNDKLISAALLQHKTQSSAIRSLARLAEFRDHQTGDHLQRICEYSRLISEEVFKRQPFDFKIWSGYPDDIFNASMLHDIGKVGIPDQILLKQGKLDTDEWKIMKNHTVIGWTILNQADCDLGEQSFLTLASKIALSHHERWDGSGYPYGVREDEIPLSARISAVADVYDALTSERPYKKPWHHDDAIREIREHSGVSFDPVMVDILLSIEKKMLDVHYRFPK